MKIRVALSVVSVLMVCVGAVRLGGNSPAKNDDQAAQKARAMVNKKIQELYPGAKVSDLDVQTQVVKGIRYNLTFKIEYTPKGDSKTQKECTASLVQAPGQQTLEFVTQQGSKEITCA